jgi:hypothetical protein
LQTCRRWRLVKRNSDSRYATSLRTRLERNATIQLITKMEIFDRNGFIDRYSGRRLVFPGTLRLLSEYFKKEFPYHTNWKTGVGHLAYYELYPTIDHLSPVTRDNGTNDLSNLVTTSQLLNSAKAHFTLSELGWELHKSGKIEEWDGLTKWFLKRVESEPQILDSKPMNEWYRVAKRWSEKRNEVIEE